jgi:hypothetical protein
MSILLIIFLTATLLWLIYWAIVRQSILDAVEDDLAHLRNRVEWFIIDGAPESQSKSAQILVSEIDCDGFIRWLSFSQIAVDLICNRKRIKIDAAKEKRIFEASPQWIREARNINTALTLKAALANSPTWWIPLPAILLGAMFSWQISDWWNDVESSASKLRSEHFGTGQAI